MAETNNTDFLSTELPPSYEQSLGHRRLEDGYVLPHGYSTEGASYHTRPHSRPRRNQHPETPRQFRLPSTDFNRGAPPVVVREDDSASTVSSTDEQTKTCLKLALPPMHMCIAITCLILNIITPGIGTILAGWGVFCCTKSGGWVAKEKCISCSLNFVIGLLQIILIPVILLGWIWSVVWGFALLGVSLDEYHGMKDEDDDEEESSDRPRSGALFRRIPPLSVTRQAMRQNTSRVSIAPSTGNRSDGTANTVCQPVSPATRIRNESEIPAVHTSSGSRESRVASRQVSRSGSQHSGARSTRPNSRQSSVVERPTPREMDPGSSTPRPQPARLTDQQDYSGTRQDSELCSSNSSADTHRSSNNEASDIDHNNEQTDGIPSTTLFSANSTRSGSIVVEGPETSMSHTRAHIQTAPQSREDEGMAEINM